MQIDTMILTSTSACMKNTEGDVFRSFDRFKLLEITDNISTTVQINRHSYNLED